MDTSKGGVHFLWSSHGATVSYTYISTDKNIGMTKYQVKYTFGTESATRDINFDGFKTNKAIVDDLITQDHTSFTAAIPSSIDLTGKPTLDSIEANMDSINAALIAGGSSKQIPTATGNVKRTYNLTKDSATGEVKVDVTFKLDSGADQTYTFTLKGFKTGQDGVDDAINADMAQFKSWTQAAKDHEQINDLKKDDITDIAKLNSFVNEELPIAIRGVTRTFKVTSEANATTLKVEVSFIKAGGTTQTKTYTITDLISQADFDSINLKTKLTDDLKTKYVDKTKKASEVTVDTTPMSLTIGATTFTINVSKVTEDDPHGSLTLKYTATATGLNKTITDVEITLSGFKNELTPSEKKTNIQDELDKITAPIDSKMPTTKPTDFKEDDAKRLLEHVIATDYGVKPTYVIKSTADGQVVVTVTYKLDDANTASGDITINGLKTNEQINKENNQQDVNSLKDSFTINPTLQIDDVNGLPQATDLPLDQATATKLGITIPADLKGSTLTYSHPSITADGHLTIIVKIVKGTGSEKAETIVTLETNVTGINEAKVKEQDQNLIDAVDAAALEGKLNINKDQLPPATKPTDGTLDNGVNYTVKTWTPDPTNGEVAYEIEVSKGNATSRTITGTITGFNKLLADIAPGDITGTTANEDGTTIETEGTINNQNVTLVFDALDGQGAKTVKVTVKANDGYSFANNKKSQVVENVTVNQDIYESVAYKIGKVSEFEKWFDDKIEEVKRKLGPDVDTSLSEKYWEEKKKGVVAEINSQPTQKDIDAAAIKAENSIGQDLNDFLVMVKMDFTDIVAPVIDALSKIVVKLNKSTDEVKEDDEVPFDKSVIDQLGTIVSGVFPTLPETNKGAPESSFWITYYLNDNASELYVKFFYKSHHEIISMKAKITLEQPGFAQGSTQLNSESNIENIYS